MKRCVSGRDKVSKTTAINQTQVICSCNRSLENLVSYFTLYLIPRGIDDDEFLGGVRICSRASGMKREDRDNRLVSMKMQALWNVFLSSHWSPLFYRISLEVGGSNCGAKENCWESLIKNQLKNIQSFGKEISRIFAWEKRLIKAKLLVHAERCDHKGSNIWALLRRCLILWDNRPW